MHSAFTVLGDQTRSFVPQGVLGDTQAPKCTIFTCQLKVHSRVREVAHSVKHLACMYKTGVQFPELTYWCAYILSTTEEAETGRSLGLTDQPVQSTW